jgi:hypothetical protein
MAYIFTPTCRFVQKLALGEGIRAYLFRDGEKPFAVVWAARGAKPRPIRFANEKLQLWDLMARPQAVRDLTPSGTPVYIIGEGLSDAEFAAALK